MKKNHLQKLVLLLTLIIGLTNLFALNVAAATVTKSIVNTNYTLFDDLSAEEQATIIEGVPKTTLTHDKEDFLLVYRKNADTIVSNSHTPITESKLANPSKKEFTKANEQQRANLPKTGEMQLPFIVLIGGVLFITAFGLLIWNRKKGTTLLLAIIFAGSLGTTAVVNAAEQSLPESTTQTLDKGSSFSPNTDLAGYEYVGYIHQYSDNPSQPNVRPTQQGTITVKYQDEAGNSLTDNVIVSGNIGENYTTEAKEIDGYTYKSVQGNPSGTFSNQPQTVVYTYEQNAILAANVLVKYVDQNGNELRDAQTISGQIGDSYDASTEKYQVAIDGYTLDTSKLPANIQGSLSEQAQEILFVYTKNQQDATITIKFVDAFGDPFVLPDLTTIYDGQYVDNHPNLDKYFFKLSYNGAIYSQTMAVTDITIPTKIGESYSLPEYMKFKIYDENGLLSNGLQDKNMGGYILYDYSNVLEVPSNSSGVVEDSSVTVTYTILPYRASPS